MQEIKVADPRAEAIIAAYQQVVMERLDEGLRAIQQSATTVMEQVASEAWAGSGSDGPEVQQRILAALSRDQVLRGMMTTTDERYQALSTRIADIESSLSAMSRATGELRAIATSGVLGIGTGTGSGEDVAAASAGFAEVKQHMIDLEGHLEAAFAHMAERDQTIIGSIRHEIKSETAEAIGETTKRVEEIEQFVKGGANAMGHLVRVVQDEVKTLRGMADREIEIDPERIKHAIDEGIIGLARLVRSDSTKLAELIQAEHHAGEATSPGAVAAVLDARLGRMSELVSATTMSAVGEVARKVPAAAADAMQGQFEELSVSIDRSFVTAADSLESHLRRASNAVVERTAEAVDRQIADRLGATIEHMNAAVASMQQTATATTGGLGEAAGEDLADLLDSRLTALAKLIRSDNRAMADVISVAAEQQAAKEATRAVKELAAALPAQVLETLDRRFAEFAEHMHRDTQLTVNAIAKSTDVVANRMDRVGVAIGQQYDEDMQRLGNAVSALSAGGGRSE